MDNKISISLVCVLYYSGHLVRQFLINFTEIIGDYLRQVIFVNNSSEAVKVDFNDLKIEVLIINNKLNIGYGAALNVGVQYAKYPRILLCNPDIYIEEFIWPDTINNYDYYFLSGIVNNKLRIKREVDFFTLFLNYAFLRMYGKLVYPLLLLNRSKNISKKQDLTSVNWFSGCFIITNKQTYNYLGGFDERFFLFFEETDLLRRAKLKKIPIFITHKIKIQTRNGKSSNINVDNLKKKAEVESMLKYLSKHNSQLKSRVFKRALKVIVSINKWILFTLRQIFRSEKLNAKLFYYIMLQKILAKDLE